MKDRKLARQIAPSAPELARVLVESERNRPAVDDPARRGPVRARSRSAWVQAGQGYFLHLDPRVMVLLSTFAPVGGRWQVQFTIPWNPAFLGMQSLPFPTQGGFVHQQTSQLTTTNAILLSLGM